MKQNRLLITGSCVLVAAWMNTGTAIGQSSSSTDTGRSSSSAPSTQEVHPSPKGSIGASKSERADETGTPLPKGSPQSGTVDMGSSGSNAAGSQSARGTSNSARMAHSGSAGNVKEAQQALKDKGYDPGAVDGVMGAKTKEAIKSFQSASNLQATGTLDTQTAEKLGVQSGSSSSRSSFSSSSSSSRDNMKSSNTTVGKDTDQPNQTPSKNR